MSLQDDCKVPILGEELASGFLCFHSQSSRKKRWRSDDLPHPKGEFK